MPSEGKSDGDSEGRAEQNANPCFINAIRHRQEPQCPWKRLGASEKGTAESSACDCDDYFDLKASGYP